MRRFFLLCVPLVVAGAALAEAEDAGPPRVGKGRVSLTAQARPTVVTVGDRILYRLAVVAPESATVSFPPVGGTMGEFSVVGRGQASAGEAVDGLREHSILYRLAVYGTGDTFIPPVKVVLREGEGDPVELGSGAIAVRVESVLDDDPKDIKDIKPPIGIPYVTGKAYLWLLLAAAGAALAAVILVRRARRKARPEAPAPPPHVCAYEELRRILAMDLIARGRVKEYYIRLSGTLRRYVEGRFGLRAPERTTEEFLEEARLSGRLDAGARTLVGDFLEQCDRVKFARYSPGAEECEKAYRSATRFVDETKPRNEDM